MRALLLRIAVHTLVRMVFAISVLCLLLWLGILADMYSTAPPADHGAFNMYAPGGWPSPLPMPT